MHDKKVICADGRPMMIRGWVWATLEISGEEMTGCFLVDITPEGILGTDLLGENGILVDIYKQRLLWTDEGRPLRK